MLYFEDGKVIAESGDVSVYKYDGGLYLEIGPGHNLWMSSLEIEDICGQIKLNPRGDCLEIGLGLGMASNFMLFGPIDSLTTIEKSKDVMECYRQLLVIGEYNEDIRHNIILGDVHNVLPHIIKNGFKYDFIFFDHYSLIDEDTIEDLEKLLPLAKQALKKDGMIMGWLDPYTPTEFKNQFYKLFEGE